MNSDNLGVGELTLSNAKILRTAAAKAGVKAHFLAMSWQDRRPDYPRAATVDDRAVTGNESSDKDV